MIDSLSEGCALPDISEQDVLEAMKTIPGYIDITPADFREVYRVALVAAQKRIMTIVKVTDIMSSPVHTIQKSMDLVRTAKLLAERRVSGAPVVDDHGKVVGMVSEKDFLVRMGAGQGSSFMMIVATCLESKGCVAAPLRKLTAGDIMISPAITAREDISAAKAAALLMERGINRLPIIDSNGYPLGIVTRSDLVRGYGRLGTKA